MMKTPLKKDDFEVATDLYLRQRVEQFRPPHSDHP